MENLVSWSRFVTRQAKAPPLIFLSGVRHRLKRGVSCPMHSHRAIEIVYHPVGRGMTRLKNDRVVDFAEGGIVVYAPDEMHDQVMEIEGEDLCLRIGVPGGRRDIPRKCFSVPDVQDASILEDIRMLSRGQVSPAEQTIFNLRATSTLYALVHLACTRSHEKQDGAKRHVLKAERYLRDHFASLRTLREVAEHIGISYDHLRHAFKAQRGSSLIRYLNEVRVDRAKTLLVHSQLPLKQVAALCGFTDEYYFSAVFRNFAGKPPGRYRAKLS